MLFRRGAFETDGTLRDASWLYGHDPGDHDGLGDSPMNGYNVPLSPAVEIGEAARMFGLPNVCVCRWGLSDDAYLEQFKDVKRLSWVITGAKDERYFKLVAHNFKLIRKLPNLVAFDLDDYFRNPERYEDEWIETEKGRVRSACGALAYDELIRLRAAAKGNPDRPMDLQLVLYDHQFREELRPVIEASDIVQYWTWCGKDLAEIEKRFREYRALAPDKPTFLGVYMWDYGSRKPLDVAFMKKQLDVGYDLWKRGEVLGFVFHCSNLINKGLPAVAYARDWFALHADERRETAVRHVVPEPVTEQVDAKSVNITNLAVAGSDMLARRAALDGAGRHDVRLLIGGDEWIPFRGKGVRQILAAADGRLVIVEPSGRIAWQHVVVGKVSAVGALRNWIYYSVGRKLLRVRFSLPCNQATPAETVFEASAEGGEVVGFDFTVTDLEPNGRIVLALGRSGEVVVVDPETKKEHLRFSAGPGVVAVRARIRETFSVAHANDVCEYSGKGVQIGEVVTVSGAAINDAILLPGGSALVARDEAVEEIGRCGCVLWRFDRTSAPNLENARFTSVQRINKHTVLGLSHVGRDPKGIRPAALGVNLDKSVVWSCSSPADSGMPVVQRLQARRDYD